MTNGEMLGQKLYELRKQHGLSQEVLAEKLGVSRQAVSKWECGESLPDTDNLITISKIYAVSLDDLVGNTAAVMPMPAPEHQGESEIDSQKPVPTVASGEQDRGKKLKIFKVLYALPYPVLATVIFIIWGFIGEAWEVAWTVFITIPLYYSLVECIRTKRFSAFAYPVFATFVYLFIGMQWGLWHPYWIIYITIPIYYAIADAIDRR
ncbi:MAG: helix-turn-helix domain-containing protein [Ruminococcaceae bacterium]|nr:helix-turn-helix domain-containing protein [Oscillospiraceae bacterium]